MGWSPFNDAFRIELTAFNSFLSVTLQPSKPIRSLWISTASPSEAVHVPSFFFRSQNLGCFSQGRGGEL